MYQLILFSCCFRLMLFMLFKILLKTDTFLWDRDPFNLRILYTHLGQSTVDASMLEKMILKVNVCTRTYVLSPPHNKILQWATFIRLFRVVIFVPQGPSQLRIISHIDQPSCSHCGEFDFESLYSGYVILPVSSCCLDQQQ